MELLSGAVFVGWVSKFHMIQTIEVNTIYLWFNVSETCIIALDTLQVDNQVYSQIIRMLPLAIS